MILGKEEFLMLNLKNDLNKNGYIILRNFLDKERINYIRKNSEFIFETQFRHFGYRMNNSFKVNAIKLFNEHEDIFQNCGKLIQTGLFELYQLASDNLLRDALEDYCEIKYPLMCTRPVLFFNHPKLAKSEEYYYKTPQHFDWPSIQSSNNSVVVWVPLVDVNKKNGSLILYPGTHKQEHSYAIEGGFAKTKYKGESIQSELNIGDIIIFSTKLIHESGKISNDTIRWSASFRYTDMLAPDFIEAGYPSLYKYLPITKQ